MGFSVASFGYRRCGPEFRNHRAHHRQREASRFARQAGQPGYRRPGLLRPPRLTIMNTRGVIIGLLISAVIAAEASWKPPECTVYRAGSPIKIDGKLDEPAWVGAPDIGDFHFTWWK